MFRHTARISGWLLLAALTLALALAVWFQEYILAGLAFVALGCVVMLLRSTSLWVTEPTARNLKRARRFFDDQPRSRAIVLGSADADWTRLGAVVVEDIESLESIRTAVHTVSSIDPGTKS